MKLNAIKSIKGMFDKKVNRDGYSTTQLYHEKAFKDYIECANPYMFLKQTNKIKILTDECKKYLNLLRCPMDYELYFEDIQSLGKKEVQELIIWRNKLRAKKFKKLKNDAAEEDAEKQEDEVIDGEADENYDEKQMEEIDKELHGFNKQKKKKVEKEKKKRERNQLNMQMSFINEQDHEDHDVDFDQGVFEMIKKSNINLEDLEYRDLNKDENDRIRIPEQQVDEIALSDLSEDDYIKMMNDDIENNMQLFEDSKGRSHNKKKRKIKRFLEDGTRNPDFAGNEEYNEEEEYDDEAYNKDSDGIMFMKNENGDEDRDHEEIEEDAHQQMAENENDYDEQGDSILGDDDEEIDDDLDSIDDMVDGNFEIENPLRKEKYKKKPEVKEEADAEEGAENMDEEEKDEEGNLSSDTDEETDGTKKLTGRKTKRSQHTEDDLEKEIELVKNDKKKGSEYKYDNNEIAEIRAIAKKMLRKKDRLNILYKTYNRFAFNDINLAPDWFADDEKQHNVPSKPVTKDEVDREKELMKQVNDRMPKKVLEAKSRKKNKLAKRMERIKKQAQTISNQEEINEFSKVKQIEKLYKKERAKNVEKKKYVVSRSHKTKTGKEGRNLKFVDKRLKKDKRATKAIEKRKKR